MKSIDLHQDLMTHIRFKEQFNQNDQTGFEMIEKSDLDLVVATAFPMPPDDDQEHETVHALITEEIEMYQSFVHEHAHWDFVLKADDINLKTKKLLLHIEGLNIFTGSVADWEQLDAWYVQGVRSVATHWNIENALGGGTLQPEVSLTPLGSEVIAYLERRHMIFDMAHMGRQAFWGAEKIVKRPIYISHGNADTVCPNVRNYTDEQLLAVAKSDGVVGVFFPNTFVVGLEKKGSVEDVITHIVHMKKTVGTKHIAVGSDFGGIVTGTVEGLDSVDEFSILWDQLSNNGFTSGEIEDIAYNNARRVIEIHLG